MSTPKVWVSDSSNMQIKLIPEMAGSIVFLLKWSNSLFQTRLWIWHETWVWHNPMFNSVFKLIVSESYNDFLPFKHYFCSISHWKLYSYFSINLQRLLKLSSKINFKVIKLMFCNLFILGVTWKAIIKRFDSILRHASLKL